MRRAIHAEIERLKTQDVSDDELRMVKTRAKATLIRGLASNSGLAQQLADAQTRYGDWRELFRQVERIDQVTKQDIRRVANSTFIEANRTVGSIETIQTAGRRQGARIMNSTSSTPLRAKSRVGGCRSLLFSLILLFFVSGAIAQQQPSRTGNPAAAAASSSSARDNFPSSWRQIPTPPLPRWNAPTPKRIELANGMIIFLQEDHELPLINGYVTVRGGSRAEPANKVGMLDIYGDVWRTGGTSKMTGDQMDDFLEMRAAKIETDDSKESTTISFDCLKGDFDDVFPLFVDVLKDPAFREDKIELAKNELNTGIARRNDSSQGIADREAAKLVYGKDNPYARSPEFSTVAAVTRDDLLAWYKQHVAPNNIIFGIVGDFDSTEMERRVRSAFEGWSRGPQVRKPDITLNAHPTRAFTRSIKRTSTRAKSALSRLESSAATLTITPCR